MHQQYFISIIIFGLTIFTFSGCTERNAEIHIPPSEIQEKQVITKEGTIRAKEITRFEEGTHTFTTTAPEQKEYFLNSKIIDLSRYENKNVRITGEILKNPSLDKAPVITVYSIDSLLEDPEIRDSIFTEADYSFAATLPGDWMRTINKDGEIEYSPEENDTIIRVSQLKEGSKEMKKWQKEMISGSPVNIGGKSAWQIIRSGGKIDIIIPMPEKKSIILFQFNPGEKPNYEKVIYYQMLTGLQWIEDTKEKTSEKTGEEKIFCGGVAKKLCPTGYRCELSSFEKDATGVCVDATLPPNEISKILQEDHQTPELIAHKQKEETATSISLEQLPSIPVDWKEYRRERFSYSFSVPKSWWWKESGGSGNTISQVDIATEEVTDTNKIISIKIVSSPTQEYSEVRTPSSIEVSLPRNENTSFLVSGKMEYSQQVIQIASSLSSF